MEVYIKVELEKLPDGTFYQINLVIEIYIRNKLVLNTI